MKKIGILSVALLLSVVAFSNVTKENNKTSVADLESSTTDFVNEKSNVKKVALRNASSGNNAFKASKIYFQTASDAEGYEYLRFAAALRGAYSKVSFTRKIAGLGDKTDEVTTLYKGIAANGKVSFTNGDELVDYDVTSTKNYYWACYTIRFKSDSTYKDSDITLTLNVDDKYTDSRTISLNAAKTYVEDKTNIKWNEYDGYASIYNSSITYSYDLVKSLFNVSGHPYVHGVCNDLNDSRYAYFSMGTNNNQKVVIAKYDFETHTVVGYSKEFIGYNTADNTNDKYTWTDNANIFMYKDKIYALDSYGKFVSVKASEITGNSIGEVTQNDTTLDFKLSEQIKSVAYSKEKDRFAVNTTSDNLYIFDGELNQIKTVSKAGKVQTIYSDGNKIYMFAKHEQNIVTKTENEVKTYKYYDTATITTYDWEGNKLTSKTYGDEENPVGPAYEKKGNRSTNLQNMIIVNGELYITRLIHSGSAEAGSAGGYLFKVNVNEKEDLENLITSRTLGEYVEAKATPSFAVNEMVAAHKVTDCGYLQGVTTDGDSVYYAYTNGSNSKARLVRSNPLTGESFTASNLVTIDENDKISADAGKIFYYNDNIWVTKRNSKTVFEVNKDTFVETGDSLTFDNMPEILKNAAYDKFNDRLVLLGVSGALYTYDKNSKVVSKLADAKGFSDLAVSNLFANDDYIYVTYTTNGIKGVKTSIFDFNGKLIKQVAIEDTTNISPNTNNFNTQGLIDYKGVGIIIGLSWDSTYGGGYVYSVKMN